MSSSQPRNPRGGVTLLGGQEIVGGYARKNKKNGTRTEKSNREIMSERGSWCDSEKLVGKGGPLIRDKAKRGKVKTWRVEAI